MIRTIIFILFLLIPFLGSAQNIGLEEVREINREAIELNREGEFEKARQLLDALLSRLEEEHSEPKFKAVSWQTLAKVEMNLGNYDKSFKLARKSLDYAISAADSASIADNFNTIGINHYHLSDYDSTTFYYEKSLEIKRKISQNPYSVAVSEYNLGIVYEDLGDPARALEMYHGAERNLLRSGEKRNFLSDVYVGISHIHFYAGEIEKAEIYAEKALNEGLISYGDNNPNITFVYTSYANILEYQQKYKESIELLEKSLRIRQKSFGEGHRWTCETYYDLANAYRLDGQSEKAEELFKQAISVGENTRSRQYLSYAKTYLAGLYVDEERNLDQAERLLLSSLKEKEQIFGKKNEVVAENYIRLARIASLKGDESAFFDYVGSSFESSNYDKDSIQKVIAPFHSLETLMLESKWFEKEFERTSDPAYLLEAFELLDEQVALIHHIERNFSSDRSKINLANEYRDVFESGLNLCWRLFQQEKDPIYLERAFDLSETNRNTTLLHGLQDIQSKLILDLPEEILQLEESYKRQLERVKMDLYYEKSAERPDKEFLKDLFNRRIGLTISLDSLYEEMGRQFPSYDKIKNQTGEVDLADVQNRLDPDSQMLAYFLGEEYLYSFAVTKDTVRFLRGNIASRIYDKTTQLKNRLTERDELIEEARELYLYLIYQQHDPSKKKMILIPDNILNYIPFEILKDDQERYLLEDFTISYSGGARIFLELNNEFFDYDNKHHWAGFAPVYKGDRRLSSNEDEVRLIADRIDGDSYLGEEANTNNFFELNRDYSILHLAMHAEIDNNNPEYSQLIFSDTILTSSEISLSRSRANLAVLSACNTGFGKLEKGEGVMSMARAFHLSGVPSVVMSLWKVPDTQTKRIMLHFYDHLMEGDSKSVALKKAKLDYLQETVDPVLRHPYYWAGFVINGNTQSLDIENNSMLFLIGISVMALLLVAGFKYAGKRKGNAD